MIAHRDAGRTGFPFRFSRDDYLREQRLRSVDDLQREVVAGVALVEALQYEALEHADAEDGTYTYIAHQLPAMVEELERKHRLLKAHREDPLCPRWPRFDRERFRARIDAVKVAWSCERVSRELLLMEPKPAGKDELKAKCPLPGCPSQNPHFYINVKKDCWHCWSCDRGGDVFKLVQYALNVARFLDALTALERESGARR
jgi:hypothetical protein